MIKYLAVDSDVDLANYEACEWAKHGIGMERVDNMTAAIQKLKTGEYLYVGINDDAVDFMPLLLKTFSIAFCMPDITVLKDGRVEYILQKSSSDNAMRMPEINIGLCASTTFISLKQLCISIAVSRISSRE